MESWFTPEKIQSLLVTYPVFLFSLVFHEYAHAWMGLRRGDDLAKHMGRLTLNPLPHIDPIGTVLMPLFLMLSNWGFMFGWAKPVPMNPRTSSKDMAIIAAAGPASNVLLIPLFAAAAFAMKYAIGQGAHPVLLGLHELLVAGAIWNVVLAYFNLIPIPPLDGSKILYYFLPIAWRDRWNALTRYSWLLLLVVIFTPLSVIVLGPMMAIIIVMQMFI